MLALPFQIGCHNDDSDYRSCSYVYLGIATEASFTDGFLFDSCKSRGS